MNWVVRIADDAQLFINGLPNKASPTFAHPRVFLAPPNYIWFECNNAHQKKALNRPYEDLPSFLSV